MGVSKNRDTQKWMVYSGKPIKIDDLGGKPTIFGNIHIKQPVYVTEKISGFGVFFFVAHFRG